MYSQQQADQFGTFLYIKDGVPIEVSSAGIDPEFKTTGWPDKVLLGEVGSFYKKGREGTVKFATLN